MSEIEIIELSPKGWGVGIDRNKKSIEVAHALIGDLIDAKVGKRKKKGLYQARLLSVLKHSSNRVAPVCSHTRICGGCVWQELAYDQQLKEKEQIVHKAFHTEGVLVDLAPIIPSPKIFGYRNKMEFTFSQNRAGEKFLGLMIAGSRYVFNVARCHLIDEWASQMLDVTRRWWEEENLMAYQPHKNEGDLKTLTLRQTHATHEKMVVLTVSGDHKIPSYASFVKKINEKIPGENPSIFVKEHHTQKGMPSFDTLIHLSGKKYITEHMVIEKKILSFQISPTSFFQPNTLQAQTFYQLAFSLLELSKRKSVVFDLYSGTGTLAIIAASFAHRVIAIEQNPQSVEDAKKNAKINKIENIEVYQGDVEKVLPTFHEKMDAVIVDPPRAGLSEKTLDTLGSLLPSKILYISCNPITQAKDVAVLIAYGYKINTIQPVDQFPHTPHVENIVLLTR